MNDCCVPPVTLIQHVLDSPDREIRDSILDWMDHLIATEDQAHTLRTTLGDVTAGECEAAWTLWRDNLDDRKALFLENKGQALAHQRPDARRSAVATLMRTRMTLDQIATYLDTTVDYVVQHLVPKPYTEAYLRFEQMLDEFRDGLNAVQAAPRLGVHETTVRDWLRRRGIKTHRVSAARALELFMAGVGSSEAARMMRTEGFTVLDASLASMWSRWRRKHGVGQQAKIRYQRVCEHCGTEFGTAAVHARFCSTKCRNAWRRASLRNESSPNHTGGITSVEFAGEQAA